MTDGRFAGWLADGRRATRRQVEIDLAADHLRLRDAELGGNETWPYEQIRLIEDETRRGPVRVACGDARLEVTDPVFADALHRAMPELRRGRRRILRRGIAATLLFAVAILGLWQAMPVLAARVVPLIPHRWEERFGDRVMRLPIAGSRCWTPAGQAALDGLTKRLLAGTDLPWKPTVIVRSSATVNAFTFPGGRIVLLHGLLREAHSADEVAGVLAHELTHALKRHSTRALIANAGLSLLFELTFGAGTGASLGFLLATLSYSRDMEAEADAGATALLARAGIDTTGFADFFERLESRHSGSLPAILSTHPPSADRANRVREIRASEARPALTEAEWQALREICTDKQ